MEVPTEMPYGDRRAMIADPWGNRWQIANGWHLLDWSLEKRLEFGFGVYDCLYAMCQERVKQKT